MNAITPKVNESVARLIIELIPKPTARILNCGIVRLISPITAVDSNRAMSTGAAARIPKPKL